MGHGGAGRVHPRRAVHPAAGVRRGRGEVQAAHPGLGAAQPRHRPEHELLVQGRGTAVDGPADEVLVAGLQLPRAEHPAGADPRAEPGRQPLEAGLHPVGEPLPVGLVPDATDALVTGVPDDVLRDVRVGPQGLRAGR